METLKQRTIDGTKYTLERQPSDEPGKQYEYLIQAGKGQSGRTKTFNRSNTIYRRDEAERMFMEIVSETQEAQGQARQRERNQSDAGMAFTVDSFFEGGGSGPQMPDFGGFGTGMQSDDDEDEPMFPWF